MDYYDSATISAGEINIAYVILTPVFALATFCTNTAVIARLKRRTYTSPVPWSRLALCFWSALNILVSAVLDLMVCWYSFVHQYVDKNEPWVIKTNNAVLNILCPVVFWFWPITTGITLMVRAVVVLNEIENGPGGIGIGNKITYSMPWFAALTFGICVPALFVLKTVPGISIWGYIFIFVEVAILLAITAFCGKHYQNVVFPDSQPLIQPYLKESHKALSSQTNPTILSPSLLGQIVTSPSPPEPTITLSHQSNPITIKSPLPEAIISPPYPAESKILFPTTLTETGPFTPEPTINPPTKQRLLTLSEPHTPTTNLMALVPERMAGPKLSSSAPDEEDKEDEDEDLLPHNYIFRLQECLVTELKCLAINSFAFLMFTIPLDIRWMTSPIDWDYPQFSCSWAIFAPFVEVDPICQQPTETVPVVIFWIFLLPSIIMPVLWLAITKKFTKEPGDDTESTYTAELLPLAA